MARDHDTIAFRLKGLGENAPDTGTAARDEDRIQRPPRFSWFPAVKISSGVRKKRGRGETSLGSINMPLTIQNRMQLSAKDCTAKLS